MEQAAKRKTRIDGVCSHPAGRRMEYIFCTLGQQCSCQIRSRSMDAAEYKYSDTTCWLQRLESTASTHSQLGSTRAMPQKAS